MNIEEIIKLVVDKADELEWTVTVSDLKNGYHSFNFQKFSPAGQDFNFEVDLKNGDIKTFIDDIYDEYFDYDISYEAYIWLDSTGHGKSGAPDDMKDVYEDMETCEKYIYALWVALNNFFIEEDFTMGKYEFKKWIYDNYNVPNDNCSLAPSMLDGILDYAEVMDDEACYDFLCAVFPSIPDSVLKKVSM